MQRWIVVFMGLFLVAPGLSQAEIYKWTDTQGQVSYSDKPPPVEVTAASSPPLRPAAVVPMAAPTPPPVVVTPSAEPLPAVEAKTTAAQVGEMVNQLKGGLAAVFAAPSPAAAPPQTTPEPSHVPIITVQNTASGGAPMSVSLDTEDFTSLPGSNPLPFDAEDVAGVYLAFMVLGYILSAVGLYRLCQRQGLEHAYLSWIPIIQLVPMMRIAQLPVWHAVLFLIPLVNLVYCVYWSLAVCKALGRRRAVAMLNLIPGINLFFLPYLAYSR